MKYALEAVLRHELQHVRRRDPLRLFVGGLVAHPAQPFPVLRVLASHARIAIELKADQAATRVLGVEPLASALIKMMSAGQLPQHRTVVAAFAAVSARVAALAGRPVRLSIGRDDLLISLALAAQLVGLLAWLAVQTLPHAPLCPACLAF